jgi:hypothetical protein
MSDSFHGMPITPNWLIANLGEEQDWRDRLLVGVFCFCVSYWRPEQIALAVKYARRLMIDCGAFSIWMANLRAQRKPRPGRGCGRDRHGASPSPRSPDWPPI